MNMQILYIITNVSLWKFIHYILFYIYAIFVSLYIFIKNYTIIKGQLASFPVSHPPPLKLYVYCVTTHIYRGTFDENISKHDLLKSGLGNEWKLEQFCIV